MSRRDIPNAITVGRLCALPVFVWLYSLDAPAAAWPAAWLLLAMTLSDVLDGWLARRFGWQTDLGRVLDPVADRVLFLVVVGTLLLFGTLPWWAVLPLILRDAVLLAGAAVLYFVYKERPEIMRGGRAANFILVCGIEFVIISLDVVAWIVYAVGAALYVFTGVWYTWRESARWNSGRLARRGAAGAIGDRPPDSGTIPS